MPKHTEISVIMSVYNDGPYLAEAIESILNQTYSNFEFLLMDDASQDNSLDIIKNYAEQDARICYFQRLENQGLTKNLNYLLDEAKGTYIARMDGNDISCPERLEVQLAAIQKTDADISWTNVVFIDEQGKEICRRYQPSLQKTLRALKRKRNYIVHPSSMYKRNAVIDIDKYDESHRTGQDGDLWFRMLEHNYRFCLVDRPFVKMRLATDSVTSILVGKNKDVNYLYANCCMRNYQKRKSIRYIRRVKRLDLKAKLLMRFIGVERIYQFIKGLTPIRYDEIHRI